MADHLLPHLAWVVGCWADDTVKINSEHTWRRLTLPCQVYHCASGYAVCMAI